MANITTVNLTSGVPSGPAGPATVSTLDNLIGVAGTPVANVQTIQGIAGATAVPVSGTVTATGTIAATQSGAWNVGVTGTVTVSGTVNAAQSGAWNINNISGTVSLPTGAATAAKQPALGTAGVASTDVLTVQGIASMTALKVDGSAVTQPVSGSVTVANASLPVTQSGTWNVGITGTPAVAQSGTWTTRAVGNTGAAFDFSSAQNVATPTNAILIGGEFNTTPTTILNGNSSPLQLDSSGNLKVNIAVGGGAGGTSSSFGSAFPATGTAVGAKDSAGVNMQPLNLDASGNLKVNVAAGGASGGTSSSFGAAVPGTGTAVGFSDGANMQLAHVWDADSGAGVQWTQGVLLKTPASGGAVDIGVSGQPLRVDPTGTTTQPVSGTVTVTQATAANLNATVTGTVAVSGTVAVTQSGTWNINNISGTISLPTGAATAANQATAAAAASTTSGQTGHLALGAVTTTAPSYANATSNFLSLTPAGALRVDGSAVTQPVSGTFWQATQPVSGTVTANQGGTWNVTNISGTVSLPTGAATSANQPTAAAIGSTTAGQTGNLAMGAVTTGAPSYTTGQTNNLSLTLAGALRVDGSGVTQPVSGTFWQATQPVSGTVTANQGGAPWSENQTQLNGVALGSPSNYGTSPGAVSVQGVNAFVTNSVAVTGTFWQATQPVSGTVTVTQGTAANLNATVTGTVTVGNATLAVTQSGTWTDRVVGNAGGAFDFASTQNIATPAQAILVGAEYNTVPTTITSGNSSPLQLDSAGNLKVNTIDPSVYNAGTGWTSATGLNTVAALYNSTTITYDTIVGQITQGTTITGGAITFEESYDNGTTWKNTASNRLLDPATGLQLANPYTLVANVNQAFEIIPVGVTNIRARLSTVIAGTGTVTVGWTQGPLVSAEAVVQIGAAFTTQGDTASAATDAGNPVKIGGLAKTTNPTAVTDGQRVAATFDKQGKLIAVGAIRQLKGVQKTSITAATETTIVTAGAAGVFQDLYGLILANLSATGVNVAIKDATAGTTRMTFYLPANDTRGFTVPVDSAVVQAAAANNWTATVSSAVTSIEVTALYVSNL